MVAGYAGPVVPREQVFRLFASALAHPNDGIAIEHRAEPRQFGAPVEGLRCSRSPKSFGLRGLFQSHPGRNKKVPS